MELVKIKFKECMIYLYPQGVPVIQLRDLARCYLMAWMECLLHHSPEKAAVLFDEYLPLTATDWMPDTSWQWWADDLSINS